jgi:hypothetical protein
MNKSLVMLFFSYMLISCSKDIYEPDRIVNGVNVNVAVSTFNSYRTQGIPEYPSVGAVIWNDTLSMAAYNYAKAKTEDTNTPSNIYFLSNGQWILDFPANLNYSRNANFALYYGFPTDADVTTVINAGFASNNQMILAGLMSSTAKQFGMGQFGGKWFVIMSN